MELDKLHILFGSDLDLLSITSVPAAATGFPTTNMQISPKGRFYKVAATSVVLTASLAPGDVALIADGLCVGRHNLSNDSTVRIRLYDEDDQGGSVVYDSTALKVNHIKPWGVFRAGDPWGGSYEDDSPLPKMFRHWFTPVGYRSIQIDISAPTNTTIEVGRLMLKTSFVPVLNYSYGRQMEIVDPSAQSRTAAAGLRTEKRETYRRYVLDLDWVDDVEDQRLLEELFVSGKWQDCFVDLYPNGKGMVPIMHSAIMKRVNNALGTLNFANNQSYQLIFEET